MIIKSKTIGKSLATAISNIESQIKNGIKLNLSRWFTFDGENLIAACIAGCTLLSHGIELEDALNDRSLHDFIDMLDDIGKARWTTVYKWFYETAPSIAHQSTLDSLLLSGKRWDGLIEGNDLEEFLKSMRKIAAVLIKNKI